MRRLLTLTLACVLLLAACGAPAEESTSASSGGASNSSASAPVQTEPEDTAASAPFTLAACPAYSFHPALAGNSVNLALAPLMYEGLFTLDSAFQAQPVLCQSYYVSEDGLTWTFTLQSGITFSDGTPLTGEIVAQALQTARGEGSRYASRLASVSSVQGSGDQVSVTLTQPNGALAELLDIPIARGRGTAHWAPGPMCSPIAAAA